MSSSASASTLPAALDSLLGQTLRNFEVIAADDGSDDQTWDVLCAYAQRDARIRPLRLPMFQPKLQQQKAGKSENSWSATGKNGRSSITTGIPVNRAAASLASTASPPLFLATSTSIR